MSKQLGFKLKELRLNRRWTQQELAKHSGVKRGYLASIEAGLVDNPSAFVFLKLASALSIPVDELYQAAGYIQDTDGYQKAETPEDIIEHLKKVQPVAIPLYHWDEFPRHKKNNAPPIDYIYRARSRALGREMTAYVLNDVRYKSILGDNDIIIVDKEEPITDGEIMACLLEGVPTIGRFTSINSENYFETAASQIKFTKCKSPMAIIELRRWLEEDDRKIIS